MAESTDYRSMFDRDYIGAWDLMGRDVTVTIAKVAPGVLTGKGNRKDKKPIVHFEGREKGLALNKTNAKTIAGMYGNDTTKWVGKRITLYPTTTSFGSETGLDCIRIRSGVPTQQRDGGKRGQEPVRPSIDWRDALNLHGEGVTVEEVEEAFARLSADADEPRAAVLTHARGYALKELANG